MKSSKIVTEQDMAPGHGYGCVRCGHQFKVGEEAVQDFTGMVEDIPLCEVLCVSCATDGAG